MTYRIYEIDDLGQRSVAGWGDHATMTSARAAVQSWGRVVGWRLDALHDAADCLLIPGEGLSPTWIAIERIHDTKEWTVQ